MGLSSPLAEQVAIYFSTLVVLRVQTLAECLERLNELDDDFSTSATLLWKLRLHLVDLTLNRAPALADVPACPELDPGACFVGGALPQAIQPGLARQVRMALHDVE